MEHRPLVDFDPHVPSSVQHVWAAGKQLRETCPVAWSEHHGGFWAVAGYDEVWQVLRDHKDFTTRRLGDPELASINIRPVKFTPLIPEELDPPESLKYRKRLNPLLAPKVVAELEGRIRHLTTVFIDRFIERGRCDLTDDLASALPAAVVLDWIGLSVDEFADGLTGYHDYMGFPHGSPEAERGYARVAWLNERVREEVQARRVEPRDDVLSALIHSDYDGEELPFEDAVAMAQVLVAAGADTTANAMAWALVHLGRHPEQRDRLRETPELWATATDEFLRRFPPTSGHARTAVRDVEVGGCLIRAGERVLALESSACHDAAQFDRPDEVVLERFPNRHLAFGIGTHRCVGMHLARLELRVVIQEVLRRMPDYRIDEDAASQYPDVGIVAGWQTIPVTFTPGPRELPLPGRGR